MAKIIQRAHFCLARVLYLLKNKQTKAFYKGVWVCVGVQLVCSRKSDGKGVGEVHVIQVSRE